MATDANTSAAPLRRAPPLWRQLQAVALLLRGVRDGQSLTPQLEAVDASLRPGVQALSFHVLRWLGTAEAARRHLVPRKPPAPVDALLCTALALLLPVVDGLYAPFTLVDQAVEAAKRDPALRRHASLVNACLRRFLRDEAEVRAAIAADPVARWNHPVWWIERLRQDHPDHWPAVLQAAQLPAPMVLRVNLRRTTVEAYCERLSDVDIAVQRLGGAAIILPKPRSVADIPGFAEGWVSVQSAAAQRAAPLLLSGLDMPAPRILDACAAPGGKTAHLLELSPSARVTALEIDPLRSQRIQDSLQRLGLQADIRVADAGDAASWWQGERFDGILLDAPCSASGIVRRHPDVRWLRRPTDIAQLAAQQDRLLRALWPLLVPGGRLLFCTCSVFRQEGVERIESFVAHHTDAEWLPSPGHLLPSSVEDGAAVGDNAGCDDGFYYALLAKRRPGQGLAAGAAAGTDDLGTRRGVG